MKSWCNWIILGLLLLVWPFQTNAHKSDSKKAPSSIESVANSSNLQLLTEVIFASYFEITDQENSVREPPVSEIEEQFFAFSDLKEFSSDSLPLVPTSASALLFRDNLQTKPIYWLKAEFNPPDQTNRLYSDIRFKLNNSPWFILFNQKSNGRVSGWKDGNSLYTANITYN